MQTSGQDSGGDTDSGCHMAEEPDPLAELPAKFAELEAELRVLRDQNSRQYQSSIFCYSHSLLALTSCSAFYKRELQTVRVFIELRIIQVVL